MDAVRFCTRQYIQHRHPRSGMTLRRGRKGYRKSRKNLQSPDLAPSLVATSCRRTLSVSNGADTEKVPYILSTGQNFLLSKQGTGIESSLQGGDEGEIASDMYCCRCAEEGVARMKF